MRERAGGRQFRVEEGVGKAYFKKNTRKKPTGLGEMDRVGGGEKIWDGYAIDL